MHETPRNVVADFIGRAKVNDQLADLDLPGIKHANAAYETDNAAKQHNGDGLHPAADKLHSTQL